MATVVVDAARVKQILYNYLSNAIKFSRDGAQVILRVRPEGAEHFRIEVQDFGIGIRPEDFDRLFALAKTADRLIEVGAFLPNRSSFFCKGCPYQGPCKSWR